MPMKGVILVPARNPKFFFKLVDTVDHFDDLFVPINPKGSNFILSSPLFESKNSYPLRD